MARLKILTFTVMLFVPAWTLSVDSKMVHLRQPGLNSSVPLDMVPNSVDDKYKHCTEKMYKKVQEEYLPNENSTEGIFKQAWMKAEGCATIEKVKKRFQKDKSKYNPKELTHDHIKAICAYSAEVPEIYPVFNQAVRTSRTEYTTSFPFHSLHFLLTDAIRLLKLKSFPKLGNHEKEVLIPPYEVFRVTAVL